MSNATNSEATLESILEQVRVVQAKSAERAKVTGENFNVFSILHMERYEVKTHSAIIAELLNPQGSHSQETLFLKLFLDQLLKKLHEEQKAQLEQLREKLKYIQDKNEFDKFEVEVETSKEGKVQGRIDILIESYGIKNGIENGDVCIVIENKIDAEDQERQLGRYYDYASGTGKECGIIYLTLGGDEPDEFTLCGNEPSASDESGKIKDTVVCLSYKTSIDEWLGACIKEVARIPQIRETLHQYQMTVRKLTGQLPDIWDGLKGDIRQGVQYELQREFWKEFKKQLEDSGRTPKFHDWEAKKEIRDNAELKESICDRSLVLTFSIPNSLQLDDNEHEVAFRVHYEKATDYSYFNYGFVLRRKDTLQIVDIKPEDKRAHKLQLYVKDRSFRYGWISWDYFQYEPESFITESKETLIRRLISEINLSWSEAEARKNNKA